MYDVIFNLVLKAESSLNYQSKWSLFPTRSISKLCPTFPWNRSSKLSANIAFLCQIHLQAVFSLYFLLLACLSIIGSILALQFFTLFKYLFYSIFTSGYAPRGYWDEAEIFLVFLGDFSWESGGALPQNSYKSSQEWDPLVQKDILLLLYKNYITKKNLLY